MNEAITKKLLSATKLRMRKEETEEIRIAWTELCIALIAKIDESMSAEQSELWMDIIEVAVQDKFADVQKQMARLAVLYATQCPKLVDYACERMIRIIIPLLIHKHNAVRVAGIKALDAVLVASPKGLHLLFEYDSVLDRQPIIPSLVYDTSALVLDNLFSMLGKLLCEWDPRSRYQYGELILPVILSGTLNELPTVQATCKASLFKVGLSCTGDLVDAGVLDVFPTDEKEAEKIGKL
ncbi:hypothetical protein BD560DRAFT_54516 [Blakeslea trispora]|nr:hypothetical protein BD560DRAFT_54516 [Blakeslea trispora]